LSKPAKCCDIGRISVILIIDACCNYILRETVPRWSRLPLLRKQVSMLSRLASNHRDCIRAARQEQADLFIFDLRGASDNDVQFSLEHRRSVNFAPS